MRILNKATDVVPEVDFILLGLETKGGIESLRKDLDLLREAGRSYLVWDAGDPEDPECVRFELFHPDLEGAPVWTEADYFAGPQQLPALLRGMVNGQGSPGSVLVEGALGWMGLNKHEQLIA